MKFLQILFLAGLAAVSGARAETVQEVYAQGVRAYTGGNVEEAKALFARVLAADPRNPGATAYLRRIQIEQQAGGNIEKQVSRVIIPKVDFNDASLSSVLDHLAAVSQTASNGKFALNIVRVFPAEFGTDTKVTLSLANAPLSEILKYVAQMAGLKVEYQAHAVILSQAGS